MSSSQTDRRRRHKRRRPGRPQHVKAPAGVLKARIHLLNVCPSPSNARAAAATKAATSESTSA